MCKCKRCGEILTSESIDKYMLKFNDEIDYIKLTF